MSGLMDLISKNLETPQKSVPASSIGQTEQVGNLLRTKLTGKAVDISGSPQQSSLAEAVANKQTETGLQDIATKGRVESSQLKQSEQDVQQRSEFQKQQHELNLSNMQKDYASKAAGILDNLQAAGDTLDIDKKRARMEQAGFLIRNTNQNYVQELGRQGQLNRLDDKQSFQKEATTAIMKDNMELFKDDVKFEALMKLNARDFTKALSGMSEDFAEKAAELAYANMNKEAIVKGIGSATTGAVQAYGAYSGLDDDSKMTIRENIGMTPG